MTGSVRSMGKIRRVSVFGSGTVREGSPVYRQAVKLGLALARAGFSVYHGGYGGVMEAVAKGCRAAGGTNTGITVEARKMPGFKSYPGRALTRVNQWADAEIRMPSWEGRLLKLIETGEAYVFLDGATGTLNELFLVWEMANRKLHTKPVLLLGKRLQKLVKFLKKDPALRIPESFYLVSSVDQTIKLFGAGR